MSTIFLSLGSNLGNRIKYLNDAEKYISGHIGKIELKSSIYESEAWGAERSLLDSKKLFLNQVIEVETQMHPFDVLANIHYIETKLGRKKLKSNQYSNRTIDIDILFWNNDIINVNILTIPHPLIAQRRFVLLPLNEIAPNLMHPVYKKSIAELLNECTDELCVALKHN